MSQAPPVGLRSVIVPCLGGVHATRACLAALFRHTGPPWELIVVTRGTGDASTGYLAGVRDAAGIRVEILVRPALKGFRAACRDGLRVAQGELVAVVPNTTVVTDSWLDQLAALLNADPAIAVVGATTNATRPPQGLTEVPYHDAEGLRTFAASWRTEHRGCWFSAESLSNACLVGRRQALDAIGGGRAARVMGMKSRHFAARVRRAGYSLAVARDLFVHSGPLLSERVGDMPSGDSPHKAAGPRARVSLTMIVRNEEGNLPACLESVRDLFDEIVVVDTGSTDRTVEIARSFGARVFDFVWVDDFAAARNAALARATGDYAFWLDADDVVEPEQRAKLVALLTGLRAGDDAAYVVRCACDPDTGGGGGSTVVDHVRLFPLREGVRWTYRVHEQILPALRRVGVSVRWSDVVVRHTGYADPALRRRKLVRDVRILDAELAERPGDPFVLFNLGSIAIEREDWRPALEHLRASLRNSAPEDSITRKLYALIARAHQMLGETELALAACGAGLQHDPDDAELLFRRAVIHRNTGNRTEAEACWRRILSLRRPERFSSVDQGIYGHLTRRNLAALSEEAGDRDGARRYWSEVQVECPGDAEARASLRRLAGNHDDTTARWLVAGSTREVVPVRGTGDFDPYVTLASSWVVRLGAKIIVELGVRSGVSTRAFLAGAHETGGEVWGVDPVDGHGIKDERFHFVQEDAAAVSDRWPQIDLLHVDTDPHTTAQTLRWFELYAAKCRAIALHDTHHPDFGVGAAVRAFVRTGGWDVHEYHGNPSGWTVLVRRDGSAEANGEPQ